MAVTIKDIARIAGVAHSTVSRALRGHPAIAPETVARIKQIADELGYVPSAVARGLKTSRSNALGVIISRIDDPFFSEILQGIEDETQAAGYSLFVAASNRDFEREKSIVQAMGERRVEGVIVCSGHLGSDHARQLQQYGIPLVAVDNQALDDYQFSISHDHFFGSSRLTQHLIDLGHTRIAYLGNQRSGRTTQERLNGYRHTMQTAGLPLPDGYIFDGPDGRPESGVLAAQHFLGLPQRPTAIVCFNDMMAIGLMRALQDAGLTIPQDCSLTGFDNITFSAYTNPTLTTFEQPKYELGYTATRMMMSILQDPNTQPDPQTITLRGRLIPRASTGAPFQ